MIALPESKKLICPSCGGSALSYASDAANLLEKHRRLGNADAARRAERSMLHYWQAAIDYSGHDRAFQGRLAGSLRAYHRTQAIPDFKALQWGVRRELIIPPRGTRIDNKAWIKNGKVLMRNGKVLLCDECPCVEQDPDYPTVECGTFCSGNRLPEWIRVDYTGPYSVAPGWTCPNCAMLDGRWGLWRFSNSTTSGGMSCCNYNAHSDNIPPAFYVSACEVVTAISTVEICHDAVGGNIILSFARAEFGNYLGTFSLPLSQQQCLDFNFTLNWSSTSVPCRATTGTATVSPSMGP